MLMSQQTNFQRYFETGKKWALQVRLSGPMRLGTRGRGVPGSAPLAIIATCFVIWPATAEMDRRRRQELGVTDGR